MSNKNILVTGASGFIGQHLVRRLVAQGDNVTCLVRSSSNTSELKKLPCNFLIGDTVNEPNAVATAVAGMDVVFHLAASTYAARSPDLVHINTTGFENVLKACARRKSPPTVLFVSSLAAAGPTQGTRLHLESDPRAPVSYYGKSKAACESLAESYSTRIPISIVRPPIVLGGGDRTGLEMFRPIDKWGIHFTPGFTNRYFSVIHVADLVNAIICVADTGKRLSSDAPSQGIYFASADETYSYAELGRLVGRALGRKRTIALRVAKPCFWLVAAINDLIGRTFSSPRYLNLDKFREAFAGSWACSNAKIKQETSFSQSASMLERMTQTADWYRQKGWLSSNRDQKTTRIPPHMSPTA